MGGKAFFLDRDGVLNEAGAVNKPEELIMLPHAADAVKRICDAGYDVFVVTNQGGVGLQYMSHADLERVHDKLLRHIEDAGGRIREIRACTHKPHARCYCRKPKPGMLKDLIRSYGLDPSSCYMVGDRETDIWAGKRAGTKTVLVGEGPAGSQKPDWRFPSLWEAVNHILKEDEGTE